MSHQGQQQTEAAQLIAHFRELAFPNDNPLFDADREKRERQATAAELQSAGEIVAELGLAQAKQTVTRAHEIATKAATDAGRGRIQHWRGIFAWNDAWNKAKAYRPPQSKADTVKQQQAARQQREEADRAARDRAAKLERYRAPFDRLPKAEQLFWLRKVCQDSSPYFNLASTRNQAIILWAATNPQIKQATDTPLANAISAAIRKATP